jgi:hypothetical protein
VVLLGQSYVFPRQAEKMLWHNNFSLKGEIPMVGDFTGDRKDYIITFLQADTARSGQQRGGYT